MASKKRKIAHSGSGSDSDLEKSPRVIILVLLSYNILVLSFFNKQNFFKI